MSKIDILAIDLAMSISPVRAVKNDSSVVANRAVYRSRFRELPSVRDLFLGVDATPLLVVQEHVLAFQLHAGP